MSKKNRVKKKRVKKGPPPNKPPVSTPRFTKQRIFLYVLGILMIVSMTLGILVSGLAGSLGQGGF
jgi:hypothetical protein